MKPLHASKGLLDGGLHGDSGLFLDDGLDHLLRSGCRVAQHGEGSYSAVEHLTRGIDEKSASRSTVQSVATYGRYFILQLDDDALGGLATNAFDHLEQLVVARSNDIAQFIGVKGRKDGAGGIATYARHGDELKEELALALVGKAVKNIGIFADSLIDV